MTVNATYAVITAATITTTGLGRYTATFSSPFTTQTQDVTIPKLEGGSGAPSADYYVSTTGSDSNNGTSYETPFKTIVHAVSVAQDNQTICLLTGLFEVSSAITVSKALTIIGETDDPADVVVRNTYPLYNGKAVEAGLDNTSPIPLHSLHKSVPSDRFQRVGARAA